MFSYVQYQLIQFSILVTSFDLALLSMLTLIAVTIELLPGAGDHNRHPVGDLPLLAPDLEPEAASPALLLLHLHLPHRRPPCHPLALPSALNKVCVSVYMVRFHLLTFGRVA